MPLQSLNPFNGELLQTFEEYSSQRVATILSDSSNAYQAWKETTFSERAKLLNRCADVLEQHKMDYSRLMALEMGKVIREGIAEIEKCALACRYYAENAEDFLSNKVLKVPDGKAYIQHQPIGPVLAIMPWNFPFWQVFRFAAPNLIAGNVGLLKHASNVPQCALAIEEVFQKAGFPHGVFQTLLISAKSTESVISNAAVKAVTITGSEEAGKIVASQAGKHLKKTVLELGGSDVFVVLEDANLDQVVEMAVKSRMVNCGQSCIAAKRFIIHQSLYQKFLDAFADKLSKLKIGDPFDTQTDYGTMASEHLAKELEEQVNASVRLGAKLILPLVRNGACFQPCILADLTQEMPAYNQELFGPVATVWSVANDEEAIRIANDSPFGLGGSVWGALEHAEQVASRIESGAVYVNRMMASHPALPFGGVKNSGYGRELSHLGILEFVNQKTIWTA